MEKEKNKVLENKSFKVFLKKKRLIFFHSYQKEILEVLLNGNNVFLRNKKMSCVTKKNHFTKIMYKTK